MTAKGNLRHRAVRGGVWVFGLRIVQRILALARLVILARLLSPDDFGLVGIAILTMATVDTFTQTGFDMALIQRRDRTEDYLDSAWTINVIRGLILFGGLQLVAPLASSFFRSPGAQVLIRVLALTVVLRGFENIGTIYFRKELEFNKQFLLDFAARLADFVVAVSVAFILRNAWVLVLAFLAGDLARLVASYLIHPYRPQLRLEMNKVRELFGFGKWILGSSTLVFLLNQGDKAFIGKLLGTTMLGFYQIAYRFSNLSATEFALVISLVSFPAYSKLQESIRRLREAYLHVFHVTAFVALPIAGLILILAPELTRAFLGEKWVPAVPAMRVLAVWGAVRSLIATAGPVFVGVGKPRIMAKYQFIQLCMLACLAYPLTIRWGIVGTGAAVACAGLGSSALFLSRAVRLTGCPTGDFLRLLLLPIGTAVLAAVPVAALKAAGIAHDRPLPGFLLGAGLYGSVYLTSTYLLGRLVGYRLSGLAREIITAVRTKPPKQEPPELA